MVFKIVMKKNQEIPAAGFCKALSPYTKAMMIDNSTQTTALMNQVQGCIQTYEEQKMNSDFLNALAKRSQAEKDDWSAV
uniref:Uncharacterized protein n=1 Tax=Romanomermis culicivorax TaxID=13658 RepID=A0A915HG07_ROMCU